jgi:hypothetical protein
LRNPVAIAVNLSALSRPPSQARTYGGVMLDELEVRRSLAAAIDQGAPLARSGDRRW